MLVHSENGLLGVGAYPEAGLEDPDWINAGKETITPAVGASLSASDESFGLIRSGRLGLTVLGALQVSEHGDLANWMIPNKMVKGPGGAVDLVSSGARVVVATEHCAKDGTPKIVKRCSLPLTSPRCVSRIITELAVFDVGANGLTLREIASDTDINRVRSLTEPSFAVADDLSTIRYAWND